MPQDVCCLLWSSINISLPLFPFWNGVQMTNWFHWMWGHMYSRNKLFSACTQQTSMFLLSLAWGFKLAAVMKMFFENWLWKWILCVFPVTKAGGWSEEGPVVISFSLSSPSSGSVLLSLFPKNLFISAPCLNWESVSAAQFFLVCREAVVRAFLVICLCS